MDVAARAPREENVADHHDLLRLRRNSLEAESCTDDPFVHRAAVCERELLAVIDDGNAEGLRVVERGAHQVRADDGAAVIAHRHRAGGHHLAELRERLALLPHRDRADRIHARRRDAARLTNDESDRGLIVRHGLGVRHRADGRESARRRGTCARRDRLDIFAAGLAQVTVHIDEARRDERARAVETLGAIGVAEVASDRLDLPVAEQHVGDFVAPRRRVDYMSAFE